ncbi:phospholipase D family protein [Anaerosphaera multitolerans]|uniref:Phospholipase D family protein n=1 Tax=Anaerosphaera multitolerans TaxID=2487351 RepID=A0A437S4E4_9FIRM|nr:phospholipase D family protein [Anaerosphaera multitolerans]RVU53883.1 phospholipase D family protein [Anaerosphaera multitolerans]
MTVNKTFKFIVLILIIWLIFALITSTLACVFDKTLSENAKKYFSNLNYFGNKGEGPDRACIIEAPVDALNIRFEIIKNSKKSLDIVYYKIADSISTRAFLKEVVDAANRGVKIRLLVDGKISYISGVEFNNIIKVLNSNPNIECRVYNKFNPLKPWSLHMLLHDKFIISDNEMLLLGGRNIDERHFGPNHFNKAITNDRDVFICKTENSTEVESSIDQCLKYMDSLWNYENSTKVKEVKNNRISEKYNNSFEEASAQFQRENPQFYEKTLEDYKNFTVPTAKITLIHNPIESKKKEPWVGYTLQRIALNSKDSITLQTPYSTGNKDLLLTLGKCAPNVELTMITNSAASTPNLPAFSNYLGHRKKFIDTGANIYEFQSKDSIHEKSLVFDRRLSAIGTFNLDDRSLYLDTESMLVIDSEELAQNLSEIMNEIKSQSLKVGHNNDYINSENVVMVPVSPVKKVALKITYYILRPVQFLL